MCVQEVRTDKSKLPGKHWKRKVRMLNVILTDEVGKGEQRVVGRKAGSDSKSGLGHSVCDLGKVTEPSSVTNRISFLLRKLVITVYSLQGCHEASMR